MVNLKNIKCILLDIDYTLTNSNGEVSDYTRNVIYKAREKGVYVILCSGRPNEYASLKSKLSNASPIIISDNGALIYNYNTDEVLYSNSIPLNEVRKIWNFAAKKKLDIVLNTKSERYKNCEYSSSNFVNSSTFLENLNTLNEDVLQVVANSKDNNLMKECKNFIDNGNSLEVTNTNVDGKDEDGAYFCDINIKGNSKGKAIQKLLEILNIEKDEVICFGDSMNDLSMFEVCTHKVAMKNANDKLKEISTYITEYTNDEDGVAKFIEKYIL